MGLTTRSPEVQILPPPPWALDKTVGASTTKRSELVQQRSIGAVAAPIELPMAVAAGLKSQLGLLRWALPHRSSLVGTRRNPVGLWGEFSSRC
jgi:hypothetical protein